MEELMDVKYFGKNVMQFKLKYSAFGNNPTVEQQES